MKQRASQSFPTLRQFFSALSLSGIVLLSGCGGGSSSGGNPNPNPNPGNTNLSTIRGKVVNAGNTGVAGVSVTAGGITTTTGTDGFFTLSNVPLRTTSFNVSPPSGFHRTYVSFLGNAYDTVKCTLPLPSTTSGTYDLTANVVLYSSATPPPPPTDGCP